MNVVSADKRSRRQVAGTPVVLFAVGKTSGESKLGCGIGFAIFSQIVVTFCGDKTQSPTAICATRLTFLRRADSPLCCMSLVTTPVHPV